MSPEDSAKEIKPVLKVHLQRDLERLRKDILSLGAMVEEATNKAITALVHRLPDMAREVTDGDHEIDSKELEVEDECLKILALHQPVAGDLRFIVTVMKVNNDLERVGDLAVNIAERVGYISTHDPIDVPEDFTEMAKVVGTMVKKSLDALVGGDVELARSVCRDDDVVDSINEKMWSILQARMIEDPSIIKRASHTLSASYQLERIADHATNIAEDVVFMVDGKIIRHGRGEDPA